MILLEDLTPIVFTFSESKAIGTLDQGLTARELSLATQRLPRRAQARRKSELSKASKIQKNLAGKMYSELLKLVEDYLDEDSFVTFKQLQKGSSAVIRQTYEKVFNAVIRSVKILNLGSDEDIATKEEKRWLKTAINSEMRYWNNLLQDVKSRNIDSRKLRQRIRMYADTVRSIYDSTRVLMTPAQVLIHWVTRSDHKVCNSCRYLLRHSPFTKQKLPTTPRAGQTLCLSNCRCRLVIKHVAYDEWFNRNEELPSKVSMLRQLRNIQKSRGRKQKQMERVEMFTTIPFFDVTILTEFFHDVPRKEVLYYYEQIKE